MLQELNTLKKVAEDPLNTLKKVAEDPWSFVRQWKADHPDDKVIGCWGVYVPEEVIHAAGMLPVFLPEREKAAEAASSWIPVTTVCDPVLTLIGAGVQGALSLLDGLVFVDLCPSLREASQVLEIRAAEVKWQKVVGFPAVLNGPSVRAQFYKELLKFRRTVEAWAGREITVRALQDSIALYNRHRSLLRKLYTLRRKFDIGISAYDVQAVVYSGMVMPKELHCQVLEDLLPQLEAAARPYPAQKPRIILSGSMCEPPPREVFVAAEEAGAIIVDDDLYTGSRYFATDVEESEDPWHGLGERYFHMPVCPARHDMRDWGQSLVEMCKWARAVGVINVVVQFCEPHYYYYPQLRDVLARAGIRELMIETHGDTSLGPLRLRCEALVESLQAAKGEL